MADSEPTSAAEQRAVAVAKLKRAASLPRMKDGRRPPMHTEAVSEGEKAVNSDDDKNEDESSPPPEEAKVEEQESVRETTHTPESASRSRRRSRSRSRSRGSKDLRGKFKPPDSPIPSPLLPGDSSQDEAPSTAPLSMVPCAAPLALPTLFSPIPSHFAALQRSHLLRSPTPTSPDPSIYPGTSPPTPAPLLPSLEALQRGLLRSNSAGPSAMLNRRMAMHKLTGGTETYEPSPSSTPPSAFSKLGRNNTVSGGERIAARELMLSRLGGRFQKETDMEQVSGGEEVVRSPTPKRKRRRSRRTSASAGNSTITAVSDSEFTSTSPNTPIVPPTPLPSSLDAIPPNRSPSPQVPKEQSPYVSADPPVGEEKAQQPDHERPEPTRRRSVIVEEEDEPIHSPPALPGTPPRFQVPISNSRLPHASDAPSNASSDSASASAVGVPVYLNTTQRSPSRQSPFPSSPFTTPLRERPSGDEDEEQVLYKATSYSSRMPFEDREISWVAEPVPEFRIPVDDVDHEDEEDEAVEEEAPLSARSSNRFSARDAYHEDSSRFSDSKSIVIESETSPELHSHVPPSPSSVAALSQTPSSVRMSDDSTSISPQLFPIRLSIASPVQSSPMNAEAPEWCEPQAPSEGSGKRNRDGTSATTWDKLKHTFTRSGSTSGRRSRTNSFANRERRDNIDSSISRESGASLNSTKTDRAETNGTLTQQQTQTPLMQSSSASASIISLSPHLAAPGTPAVPPASPASLQKYQHIKLFPYTDPKRLEDRGQGILSASSPDVTLGSNDDDQPLLTGSINGIRAQTPEAPRVRKLSHQASDTRLLSKYNSPPISSTPSTSSQHDSSNMTPPQPPNPTGLKLPMTLPGVKQWLSKNRKIFSSQNNSASNPSITSPPMLDTRLSPSSSKKPSLSDLLRIRKESDLTDWEEINSEKSRTPTSASGSTLLGKQLPLVEEKQKIPGTPIENPSNGLSPIRTEFTDTEKTPKVRKVIPAPESDQERSNSYSSFTLSSNLPSPPEPPSSTTPDPSSSLSDYPVHSTSESSSTSSHSSQHNRVNSQGAIVLEQLDENLARMSRSPMWASAIGSPPRTPVLKSPVLQVVNSNTVKDRFLFLFTDILLIAKPVIQDQDSLIDSYKPSPPDMKYSVKSVVLLRDLRFCDDRVEPQPKTVNYAVPPRNTLIRAFIHQFSRDPDHAIAALFEKTGIRDDPHVLGSLLFKTLELDRARLGDYLSRRTSKVVLKSYISCFGFIGMRLDKALRGFLLSINIPSKGHGALEYLLDSFASRWYEANAGIVAYDKDLAIRLVRAAVQLNDLLYDGIAQEPGPTGFPRRNIARRDFVDAFRRYDVRNLVSDELLEDIYDAVRQERLCQARNPASGGPPDLPIILKKPLPSRLTYKLQSDPIILRIAQPDPQLYIHLYGQDLIFDPPSLNFGRSSEASFRVMGTSLGTKTMIMTRSGPNANRYTGLSLSSSLVVERAFMRNTFQVAFLNHNSAKRRYMFSVDDPLLRHQWSVSLKRQIDSSRASSNSSLSSGSSGASKFHRAAERIAFRILQETLLGREAFTRQLPASAIDKALLKLTFSPSHPNSPKVFGEARNGRINGTRPVSNHVRSKSRSQLYHRHGAGRNELELSDKHDRTKDESSSSEPEQSVRVEGPLWSYEDLELECRQNSSIPLVLSFLQVGAPDHGQQVSS